MREEYSLNKLKVKRRGLPPTAISSQKKLSGEQMQARTRVLKMMRLGLSLKGAIFKRDDLHDR